MKNTSEYVVQTLIDDEDMSADLASLYPAASKIGDAAAAFIDKADQTIEKKGLMGTPAGTVAKCIDICQNGDPARSIAQRGRISCARCRRA